MFLIIITAKVGIKSCRFAIECALFVHAWMQLTTQLELCVHEQTQIVASVACIVVVSNLIDNYLASLLYLFPYFL